MPRKPLGPRLYFRKGRTRSTKGSWEPGVWIIRDGPKYLSTGFAEDEKSLADIALSEYLATGRQQTVSFVYFISAASEGFPIKIGSSRDSKIRIVSLQTALPYEIETLAVMQTDDLLLERKIHRRFAHLKLRGEWFKRDAELLDFIADLQAKHMAF